MNKITDKTNFFKENLIHEISAGRYRPKEKLPSERLFCERYQISRTTARRALKELELAEIIERRPPAGAFVSNNALYMINQMQQVDSSLSVAFFMPPNQINNPLLQVIFASCRRYLPSEIRLSVIFDDQTFPVSLRGIKPDIIVAHAISAEERLRYLHNQASSMVLLNTSNQKFNYITIDNYQGGRMMAEYIIKCGHHSIGCVGPGAPNSQSDFTQRFKGISTTCKEAGIKLENIQLSIENYFNLAASCHQALDNLLIRMPDLSAVLGLYDMIALYLCESLYLRGKKIPSDMSIMGFDDLFYAQYTVPPLTTIKYPAEALGMNLAQFIRDFSNGKRTDIQETIQPVLVERQSVLQQK